MRYSDAGLTDYSDLESNIGTSKKNEYLPRYVNEAVAAKGQSYREGSSSENRSIRRIRRRVYLKESVNIISNMNESFAPSTPTTPVIILFLPSMSEQYAYDC
jgi:hypothetical protein